MFLKFWKEVFFPFFGIFVNLIFGFLFFLSLRFVYLLRLPDESSESIYPELGLFSLGFLLLGFVLRIYTKIQGRFPVLIFFFYLFGLFYLCFTLHRPFIAESLFYQKELFFLLGLIFLAAGYHTMGLQDASKGGFLTGVFLYSFLHFLVPLKTDNYKHYFILFLSIGILAGILEYLPAVSGQFLPTRHLRKHFRFYEVLYSCFFILFLTHTGIAFLRGIESLFVAVFLFLLSYLAARVFVIYFLNKAYYRTSVIYGRNLLVASFVLMSVSFSFPATGLLVFVLTGGGLGFFHPKLENLRNQSTIILLSFISIGILIPVVYLSRQNYYWIHTLTLLLSFTIFYPFLQSRIFDPLSKYIPVFSAALLSVFFFKPFAINIAVPANLKTDLDCEPIPYLLSDFIRPERKFIHIHSCLPYDSEVRYPHPKSLSGSIPILGSRKTPLRDYYQGYMLKESVPYYIVQPGNSINVSLLSSMRYKSFPGFTLYYSHDTLEPGWSREFSMDWKFSYLLDRLKEEPDFTRHPAILRKLELYAGYEVKREVEKYRNLVQKSIRNYCEYFQRHSLYDEALNCYVLELEYGDLPKISLKNSYKLLSYTTPGVSQIPLLERLAQDEEYRTSVNRKLYPIYMSVNMYDEAVRILENLIEISNREGAAEERNAFELERVRALIESDKLEKAYPLIQSALKKDPDSILWKRMLADYESKREIRRRFWNNPLPSVESMTPEME